MATAVASTQSTTASVPSITATHPSGLAAGDMLIASISCVTGGANDHDYTTPSGWTVIEDVNSGSNNNVVHKIYGKIAEASDVSAGSTTFTATGTTGEMDNAIALMARVTGTNGFTSVAANIVSSSSLNASPSSSHSFTGVTTQSVETVLLLCTASEITDGDINFSGYSVVNNNPTWTEELDVYNEPSGVANNAAMASALYAYKQATGNASVSFDTNGGSIASALIAVTENINATVTPSTLALAATLNTPTMSAGVSFEPTTLALAPTLNTPTPKATTGTAWTNKTKPSTTWTNQDKV